MSRRFAAARRMPPRLNSPEAAPEAALPRPGCLKRRCPARLGDAAGWAALPPSPSSAAHPWPATGIRRRAPEKPAAVPGRRCAKPGRCHALPRSIAPQGTCLAEIPRMSERPRGRTGWRRSAARPAPPARSGHSRGRRCAGSAGAGSAHSEPLAWRRRSGCLPES